MKFNELTTNNGVADYVPERVTISSWERPLLLNCAVSCCTLDFEEGSAASAAFLLETRPSHRPVAIVKGRPWKFNPAWSHQKALSTLVGFRQGFTLVIWKGERRSRHNGALGGGCIQVRRNPSQQERQCRRRRQSVDTQLRGVPLQRRWRRSPALLGWGTPLSRRRDFRDLGPRAMTHHNPALKVTSDYGHKPNYAFSMTPNKAWDKTPYKLELEDVNSPR